LPGAAETGLDFIDDQQDVFLIAEAAEGLGERDIQREEAAFTLHRLNDEAGYIVDVDFHAEQAVHGLQRFGAGHAVVGAGVGQVIQPARQDTDFCL